MRVCICDFVCFSVCVSVCVCGCASSKGSPNGPNLQFLFLFRFFNHSSSQLLDLRTHRRVRIGPSYGRPTPNLCEHIQEKYKYTLALYTDQLLWMSGQEEEGGIVVLRPFSTI